MILREERDGKFYFKVNLLIRLLKPVELSQYLVLTNFKYQKPAFYNRLFDKSE